MARRSHDECATSITFCWQNDCLAPTACLLWQPFKPQSRRAAGLRTSSEARTPAPEGTGVKSFAAQDIWRSLVSV